MNKRLVIGLIVALIGLTSFVAYSYLGSSASKCSESDYANNNCVPAGKCHPNPAIDAVTDCDVKDYDSPLYEPESS